MSYCWGPTESRCYIWSGSIYIRITTNLATGLQQLRHKDRPRTLWADQICINQGDLAERSAQVNLMCKVYKQAQCVLVGLGADNEESPQAPLATKLCEQLCNIPPPSDNHLVIDERELLDNGLPPASSPEWSAFQTPITLPYFSRVWVLQELMLASKVSMFWGAHPISQEEFSRCSQTLEEADHEWYDLPSWVPNVHSVTLQRPATEPSFRADA